MGLTRVLPSTVEGRVGCDTLPSTLEGRMQRLLLYTTVEEESRVSNCSHPTLPYTLEGRMRLESSSTTVEDSTRILLYYGVEEDSTRILLYYSVEEDSTGSVMGPILPYPLLWRVGCDSHPPLLQCRGGCGGL